MVLLCFRTIGDLLMILDSFILTTNLLSLFLFKTNLASIVFLVLIFSIFWMSYPKSCAPPLYNFLDKHCLMLARKLMVPLGHKNETLPLTVKNVVWILILNLSPFRDRTRVDSWKGCEMNKSRERTTQWSKMVQIVILRFSKYLELDWDGLKGFVKNYLVLTVWYSQSKESTTPF